MNATTESPATKLVAILRPLLAEIQYSAAETIDGLNPSIPEYVSIDPQYKQWVESGKNLKERMAAFEDRAAQVPEIVLLAVESQGWRLTKCSGGINYTARKVG